MLMTIAAIIVPYLYSELKEKKRMSAATPGHRRLAPAASTRAFIYPLLLLFALFYLLPLYVMLVNSLKPLDEIHGRQHAGAAAAVDARALAVGLVDRADRRRADRA